MKKLLVILISFTFIAPLFSQQEKISSKGVSIIPIEKERKADVYIDGKLFTSYIYPESLDKPVLYPLRTSTGTLVSRGFPLEPRPGERVDHPHHVGLWFNYGDVNGLDFWNNSYAIPASNKPKYGTILHDKIVKVTGGSKEGTLTVQCNWVDINKNVLLKEKSSFIFSGNGTLRKIVRITKLTAVTDVKFGDNKEGLFAFRVDRAFEEPSKKPEVYTDASGKVTSVPVLNNEGVNGLYRNSEGKEKEETVWGNKAKWVSLSAVKGSESISLCMFDHPSNFGYPGHWHARGYGLFSVNNIGSKVFKATDPESTLLLKKGESVTFKHMFIIKTGGFVGDKEMNDEWNSFAKK